MLVSLNVCKQQKISLDEAMRIFYHSEVYQLMRDGVSDMHCMSDLYLVEELRLEYINSSDRRLKLDKNK